MEYVLSKASYRRVKLLHTLSTAKKWLYLEEIAEIVGASKRTISSDLVFLEDRWPEIITIETSKKNGVRMIEADHQSIHDIYIELVRDSNALTLLEGVFFTPGQEAEHWEKELFLSHSSLYRLSRNLNKTLRKRNLNLNMVSYQVEGNSERQIRYFFAAYFYEVYGIHDWPFPIERNKVFSLANKLNKEFKLTLNDAQLMDLAFLIVVTVYRENQGFLIPFTALESTQVAKNAVKLQKYEEEIFAIVEALGMDLPEKWEEKFAFSFFWWEFAWDNPQEKNRITDLANEFVTTIKTALNVPISKQNNSKIVQHMLFIYAKHKMFPYQKYFVYNRELFSSLTIQQSFILYTEVVKKALKISEQKQRFPWYSMYFDELLNGVILGWGNLPNLLLKRRPKIKVGVFSDLGVTHATLVSNFIKNNLNDKIELVVQDKPFYEVMTSVYDDLELFVTNFKMKGIPEEKLFNIEDIPTYKEQMDLSQRIDEERLAMASEIPFLQGQ